jgi:hypothetical protein
MYDAFAIIFWMIGQANAQVTRIAQLSSQEELKKIEIQILKSAAEQGSKREQHLLGLSYLYGQGVPKDEKSAAYWISKAAEQGYADAQIDLGHLYMQGEGVLLDKAEGFKWYLKAAEQIVYGNHNQVDYGPLILRRVTGSTIVETGESEIPGVGLVLFSEEEHKRVAMTAADDNGEFSFEHVPPGDYRLVASYPGFPLANVPVKVVRWPRGGFLKSRSLVIHLELPGIDHCSYGAYR